MLRYYDDLKPKLDPSLYSLDPDEQEFFKELTGIQDDEILKHHILFIQAKAYDLYGYPCIRRFLFAKLKIARDPAYKNVIKLLQTHNDPIFLDIGCCFGNDARKLVHDGWPAENVIASDLQAGFWRYGHELFKSTPETFTAAFIPGSLNTLTSLTPLRHRISAIHASAFFHLFSEERQLVLAKRLAVLLLPKSGSIIFGQHVVMPVKGIRTESGIPQSDYSMFCHSPESWRTLWVEEVFGPHQDVRVSMYTEVTEVGGNAISDSKTSENEQSGVKFHIMSWSIRVL
ncbi:hypothetical protein CPB84DRAFT_1835288 [Gymnopilus junonius]|uniref:Methyltransferase ausD n=1 Tax=Gymnopilus junonius TaxID=109634 RepID=A0A9P5NV81_GYMJU|nr:hypothetical protein CPB84DRAFT_1835288 [Gymnopilus junonius]